MASNRVGIPGLKNSGFQKITLNTTATTFNSTVKKAHVLDISVETQNVRYTMDGTTPTASTGVLIVAGTILRFEGYNGTSLLKFARVASGAVMNVQGYRYGSE